MDWNELYRSIKEGRFERIYLFTGPEELIKRDALAALRARLLPAGLEALNDATLEGCSARDIIDACETLPVMCERRVVVVRDWAPLASGKAKAEEEDVERMLEWLKDPPESCALVFYMSVEIDGRKKLPAYLKKLPGFVSFDYLTGATLTKWCNQRLKPLGKRMQPAAMDLLGMMAGQELTRIAGELDKLAAYTGDAAEISPDAVRAVVTPSPEYSVFVILDHLLAGRLKDGVEAANAALRGDSNPVRLIALFSSQLRLDAHMKYAMDSGANLAELQRALNLNPYRAKMIQRQIRSIPAEALKERYLACVEADYAIKSGALRDRAALDMLILKLAIAPDATKPARASSK